MTNKTTIVRYAIRRRTTRRYLIFLSQFTKDIHSIPLHAFYLSRASAEKARNDVRFIDNRKIDASELEVVSVSITWEVSS